MVLDHQLFLTLLVEVQAPQFQGGGHRSCQEVAAPMLLHRTAGLWWGLQSHRQNTLTGLALFLDGALEHRLVQFKYRGALVLGVGVVDDPRD